MTAATTTYPMHRNGNFFTRAERWLDDRGRMAWIGATVLGFIVFWPVGLALLGYMIFFKKSGTNMACSMRSARRTMRGTSGNSAFDAYRAETIRRLEEEQDNFEAFLSRLRDAKDKAEFDQFMDERAKQANDDAHDDRSNDAA